jgi:hypothetical protein
VIGSWLDRLRHPLFHVLSLWTALILLGANLAIDIFAIPINFRLPLHTSEVAGSYGMILFTTFFTAENFVLQFLVICLVFGTRITKWSAWDGLRSLLLLGFVVYFVVQRKILLPQFQRAFTEGKELTGMHEQLRFWESLKLFLLLAAAVMAQMSLRVSRKARETSTEGV